MWRKTGTGLSLTYLPTGQKILFVGLDKADKSKSKKVPFGYFRYVWFEELDQFDGIAEIRSVIESLMRGGNVFAYFYSYNPPESLSNWVNAEAAKKVENRYVHYSCYLDVPRAWLGEAFFIEAEILKKQNETAYNHRYLGKIVGTGGTVFTNLVCRTITDEEVKGFSNFRNGIDWGYAVDPFAWGRWHFDKTRKMLYAVDEIFGLNLLNDEAARRIAEKNIGREAITADSAEPKSIDDLRRHGLNVRAAVKGKDSVSHGYKWLRGLAGIIIDPERTPNTWREFSQCEFERDRNGEFKAEYPDKNNHTIDECRYAMEGDMNAGGGSRFVM